MGSFDYALVDLVGMPTCRRLPSPQPSPVNGRGGRCTFDLTLILNPTAHLLPLPFTGEGWGEGGERSELWGRA